MIVGNGQSIVENGQRRRQQMLSAAQLEAREFRVGASFLPTLMAGNAHDILNEFWRLVGDPRYQPLKRNWAMIHGDLCETPALDYHQEKTGQPITRRQETVVHPKHDWFACTLDGWRAADDTVIDAKACAAYLPLDNIEAYYTPQMIGQLLCTGAANIALLVVHGGAEPVELPIYVDPDYVAVLWQRLEQFWHCVQTLTPPVELPPVIPPNRWRTINLDNPEDKARCNWSGEFIEMMFAWRMNYEHAKNFEAAKERIKELLPADVGLVTIGNLAVKRARNNAITVRNTKVANA